MTIRVVLLASVLAVLTALFLPDRLGAQSAPPQLLGLVGHDGSAHPFFSWDGTEWRSRTEDIPEGTMVVVVDSLGRPFSADLGIPQEGLSWIFGLNGIEDLVDPSPPLGFRYVGYLTSPGVKHAPFLPVESPLSVDAWETLLASAVPSRDQGIPNRFEVNVWTARAGSDSLTVFTVRRQATQALGCPARYEFTGWFPPDSVEPVIVTSSEGDCDGKGTVSRRPLGLVLRGGRPALAIAFYDWDGFGVELWEFVDGQLQVRGRESAI